MRRKEKVTMASSMLLTFLKNQTAELEQRLINVERAKVIKDCNYINSFTNEEKEEIINREVEENIAKLKLEALQNILRERDMSFASELRAKALDEHRRKYYESSNHPTRVLRIYNESNEGYDEVD